MYKSINIFIILIIIALLSGCNTIRALESARTRVAELEQINAERESRNAELAELLESERLGNKQISDLLTELRAENDRYSESERRRLEEDRDLVSGISGIFKAGTGAIEGLIEGLRLIRAYFEDQGVLAENIIIGTDSNVDNNSGPDTVD